MADTPLLVANWQAILTKAWSVWAMATSAGTLLATELVPYLDNVLPRWVIIVLILLGILLRLLPQKNVPQPATAA